MLMMSTMSDLFRSDEVLPSVAIGSYSSSQAPSPLTTSWANLAFTFDSTTVAMSVLTCMILCRRVPVPWPWSERISSLHHALLDIFAGLTAHQILKWGNWKECTRPLHWWLVGLYAAAWASCFMFRAVAARLADGIKGRDAHITDDLPVRIAFRLTWVILLPFQFAWTILGGYWLHEVLNQSDNPSEVLLVVGSSSAVLMCASLTLHGLGTAALALFSGSAWRVLRDIEASARVLNEIVDEDFEERWGRPGPVLATDFQKGMPTAQVASLPCSEATESCLGSCVICMSEIEQGDCIRIMSSCGHKFHRPCIDQWLIRVDRCPSCNVPILLQSDKDDSQELPTLECLLPNVAEVKKVQQCHARDR